MEKEDRGFTPGVVTAVHVVAVRSLLPLLFCCSLVEITSLPLAEAIGHGSVAISRPLGKSD